MKFVIFCLILLAALAVSPSLAEAPPPMLAGGEDVYRAFVGPDDIQHVAIIGGNYFFRPNHIIVRANIPVELDVNLERGMIPHSLVIDAPEAGIQVPAGTVEADETPAAAALREAREETGLGDLRLAASPASGSPGAPRPRDG